MAITWQTRGEGRHAHRFHRLTDAQAKAATVPEAPGVHELVVDGETVYTWAVNTPAMQGRPLRLLPVVYATRDDAEAHGDAWATRDRSVYFDEIARGERGA